MPTYVYRREDGSTFEVQQRITEPALSVCPDTGQKVSRVISGNAGLIFKGSGFYLTDYARKSNGSEGAGKSETKSDSNGSGNASKSESTTTKSEKSSGDAKAA